MSAALQCVIHTDALDRYFRLVSSELSNKDPFVMAYRHVHDKVREGIGNIDPSLLYSLVYELHPVFGDKRQHDCHEAVLLLLNTLAEKLKPIPRTLNVQRDESAMNNWSPPGTLFNVIDEIFKLQTRTTLRCAHCKHTLECYQCEYGMLIDDLSRTSTEEVQMTGYVCDSCGRDDTVHRTAQMVHFPPVLMVYEPSPGSTFGKNRTNPPWTIDVGGYVYSLYAVCKYYPYDNGEGGHYTVCVKKRGAVGKKDAWVLKNDDQCMDYPTDKVMHQSCILFYERAR